jgi:hypothetical protein
MSTRRHLECDSLNGKHGRKTAKQVSSNLGTMAAARRKYAIGLLVVVGLSFARPVFAQSVEGSQVKAAYLYNFAKFVEWPPEVFRSPDDPIVICATGDEHTSDFLKQAVSGKKANGRRVEVRLPHSSAEFRLCHILFVGFSDGKHVSDTLEQLRGSSVLTVGQSDQFIRLGGMINLTPTNATIDLEIAPEASSAVGLKISSRLLVVARLVKAEAGAGPGGER